MMVDLDKNSQDNAPVEDGDDTKTRKTVRLRPSIAPSGINLSPRPATPLADPLSGRDTDTGNLEVMDDTQTRKTVKLKPIAPQSGPAGINIQPGAAPAAAKPAGDGANTQTRKTIVLKPTAVAPTIKVDAGTPAAPTGSSELDDTQTRKTVKLKPSAVTPSAVKVAPGASPMAQPAATTSEEKAEELHYHKDESSDTIKISRQVLKPPASSFESSKQTMVLPGTKPAAVPAPAPMPPPKPEAPAPAQKVTEKKAEELTLKAKPEEKEDVKLAMSAKDVEKFHPVNTSGAGASKAYLIMAAVSLLLVIATATITTVQYLNMFQGQDISLPGLSSK